MLNDLLKKNQIQASDFKIMVLNLLKPFIIIFLLLLIGTIGFKFIEKWSIFDAFYMSIISLTTVGYEIPNGTLSQNGKLFTCFYLLFSVVIFLYLASEFIHNVINVNFDEAISKRKMESKVKNLKGHYIISGFGRTGRAIAAELSQQNLDFVIIEKNPDIAKQAYSLGYLIIIDDSSNDDVLLSAQIQNAKGLFATLGEDSENLFLIIAAKAINPDLNIAVRCSKAGNEEKFKRVGVTNVITPFTISGLRMVSYLVRPIVASFLDEVMNTNLGIEFRMEQFRLPKDSTLCNKTILDSEIRPQSGVYILAIERDNKFIHNPTADTILNPQDCLIVLGTKEQILKLEELIKQK